MSRDQHDAVKPSDGFDYYRKVVYWNDFELVRMHHNKLISGSECEDWIAYVTRKYGPAQRILVPNCGNGWVERELLKRGSAREAVGTDIAPNLLKEAEESARAEGLTAEYRYMDSNSFDLEGIDFDRIINHAAFHHIAYLNQALRRMAERMQGDGLLIGYDYTGPHRNQYTWEMWERVLKVSNSLPARHRPELRYPHFATMVYTDPSEAVHSELILEYVARYFDFLELVPLGGGVAYPILYENKRLYDHRDTEAARVSVVDILREDVEYTAADPLKSLFCFWVARPKRLTGDMEPRLAAWDLEETERERHAQDNGHRYYPEQGLELVYNEVADLRYRLTHREAGGV